MDNRSVGLVLGGGGVRGLAHIGVLKALEAAHIPVSYMAGSSMGGLIAALYASGIPVAEIERVALHLSHPRQMMGLVDLKPPRRGLIEGSRLRAFLCGLLGKDTTFSDLRLPLALTAVDLNSGDLIVLDEGPLVEAVMATCSVPGLLTPVVKDGRCLVDGGILNNLPVDVARAMGAKLVIAVELSPDFHNPSEIERQEEDWPGFLPGFLRDIYQAEMIMVARMTQTCLRRYPPDLLVRPQLPPGVSVFWGFSKASEVIAAGEKAMSLITSAQWSLLGEASPDMPAP